MAERPFCLKDRFELKKSEKIELTVFILVNFIFSLGYNQKNKNFLAVIVAQSGSFYFLLLI